MSAIPRDTKHVEFLNACELGLCIEWEFHANAGKNTKVEEQLQYLFGKATEEELESAFKDRNFYFSRGNYSHKDDVFTILSAAVKWNCINAVETIAEGALKILPSKPHIVQEMLNYEVEGQTTLQTLQASEKIDPRMIQFFEQIHSGFTPNQLPQIRFIDKVKWEILNGKYISNVLCERIRTASQEDVRSLALEENVVEGKSLLEYCFSRINTKAYTYLTNFMIHRLSKEDIGTISRKWAEIYNLECNLYISNLNNLQKNQIEKYKLMLTKLADPIFDTRDPRQIDVKSAWQLRLEWR